MNRVQCSTAEIRCLLTRIPNISNFITILVLLIESNPILNHPNHKLCLFTIGLIAICLFSTSVVAQPIRPTNDRIDAIVSYPIVLAIHADDERDLRRGVISKLDDGRTFVSPAFWVGISPTPTLPSWTSAPGIWTATDYPTISQIPTKHRPLGAWFIRVPMPIDAVGQGLWIAEQRYELNWLPDPERTVLEAQVNANNPKDTIQSFWSVHLPDEALNDPAIQSAIDQYHHDPFQNWRARLLTDGLNPDRSRIRDSGTDTQSNISQTYDALDLQLSLETPGADLLREIARQYEARWQIILGRVWLIDRDVAYRLKSQLMTTARFGNRILPVWSSDTTDLARLAHDLLSPYVDDETRVLRANAWLDSQPRALAWITDDQGIIEENSSRFLPTITALSLPQSPTASMFRVDAPGVAPELKAISPNITTQISVAIDPIEITPTNPVLLTQPINVRAGRWSSALQVIASPTPIRAPYVRIGPLLNDWTMDAILNDRPFSGASTAPLVSTIGILRKATQPSRIKQTTGWNLYLESSSPDPASALESITLWIGPFGNAYASWIITPDGQVVFSEGSRPHIGIPRMQTRIIGNRWIAMIDLPDGAFDQDNILQLGIERVDATGTHTAWPRRMIPDQSEPGRLSFRADNFDQLGTKDQN